MSVETQGILNNIINNNCPCCEQIWLSLHAVGGSPSLYYSPINELLLAAVVWQELTAPSIWTDVQTGSDTYPDYVDGALYRVKYTDTAGCVHYSNVGMGFGI